MTIDFPAAKMVDEFENRQKIRRNLQRLRVETLKAMISDMGHDYATICKDDLVEYLVTVIDQN